MSTDEREVLSKLIKEITETGEWILDAALLKSIKSLCKRSEFNVECAFELIMAQLKKKHAQIRYSCLQLIEQLFERSKLFRRLLTEDFPVFIQLTVGAQGKSLPPPTQFATKLKEHAIALLKAWLMQYDDKYPEIGISYQYLLDNNIVGRASLTSIHSDNRTKADTSSRKRAFQINRYELLKADVQEHLDIIQDNLSNIEGCFELLIPKIEGFEDVDFEALLRGDTASKSINPDTYKQEIAAHGLGSSRYEITIDMSEEALRDEVSETEDNKVIFDQLREAYTVLKAKHINQVNSWINTLIRIEIPDKAEKERLVKKLVRLKSDMLEAIRKAEYLGIEVSHRTDHKIDYNDIDTEVDDEFENELFEEIEVENFETTAKAKSSSVASSSKLPPLKRIFPLAHDPRMVEDPTYSGPALSNHDEEPSATIGKGKQKADDKREELLKRAPVVEWGEDLYYWDKDKVQFNSSGLERSHRFMGVGEGTNEIPAHVLENLRKRPVYYKSEAPKDLPACRHPLHNGGLCPRRDLVTCPFHGKIIPRDELGRPLNEEDISEASSSSPRHTYSKHDDTVYGPKSKKADPKIMNNLWELLEGDVMAQSGQQRIIPKKRGQRREKPESSLMIINKKPNTSLKRLERQVNSSKRRKAVQDAIEYERDLRSRDKPL